MFHSLSTYICLSLFWFILFKSSLIYGNHLLVLMLFTPSFAHILVLFSLIPYFVSLKAIIFTMVHNYKDFHSLFFTYCLRMVKFFYILNGCHGNAYKLDLILMIFFQSPLAIKFYSRRIFYWWVIQSWEHSYLGFNHSNHIIPVKQNLVR